MFRYISLAIVFILAGVIVGGYLFSDTKPRSFLSVRECGLSCLNQEELLGLLGSVGIQRLPGIIPSVQKETDKTIVIKHPFPQAPIHYVIIPKKDIKATEDISEEDTPYIIDAYAVMSALIREQNLRDYKIVINGPGFQTVRYLHFHLVSELPH
ncbi:MAG: HIT domain-containing protein [Candidatus Wildermuthbacteria bacterium]|nr:HIT domain-containing protein [Candidatus Wildermuthbacteria bacterium]